MQLRVDEYRLVRETPKGYWIIDADWYRGDADLTEEYKKWISKSSRKRFAYPTKELALTNYIKRTARYLKILQTNITNAKIGYNLAQQEAERVKNQ